MLKKFICLISHDIPLEGGKFKVFKKDGLYDEAEILAPGLFAPVREKPSPDASAAKQPKGGEAK